MVGKPSAIRLVRNQKGWLWSGNPRKKNGRKTLEKKNSAKTRCKHCGTSNCPWSRSPRIRSASRTWCLAMRICTWVRTRAPRRSRPCTRRSGLRAHHQEKFALATQPGNGRNRIREDSGRWAATAGGSTAPCASSGRPPDLLWPAPGAYARARAKRRGREA